MLSAGDYYLSLHARYRTAEGYTEREACYEGYERQPVKLVEVDGLLTNANRVVFLICVANHLGFSREPSGDAIQLQPLRIPPLSTDGKTTVFEPGQIGVEQRIAT